MTSASDEKWRPFNCFFSQVGLRTYQHPCMYPIPEKIIKQNLPDQTQRSNHLKFYFNPDNLSQKKKRIIAGNLII